MVWDESTGSISFSQETYIYSLLNDYNLQNITPRNTPEPISQELSADMCPSTKFEVDEMKDKPYANLLGKAMYAQVGMRYDISNAVKNLSHFQSGDSTLENTTTFTQIPQGNGSFQTNILPSTFWNYSCRMGQAYWVR